MARVIRRYENRKLYDTLQKRYVSLDQISAIVRQGEQIEVIDNSSGADITGQTLARILASQGEDGPAISTDFLHDVVRWGSRLVHSGVEEFEKQVDRLFERFAPAQELRQELDVLQARVGQLEAALEEMQAREEDR